MKSEVVPLITGVRVDLRVIRSALKRWESDRGQVRYYYNDWARHLTQEQFDRYWKEHGTWLDDPRDGMKVFFDDGGWLHIDGCPSQALRDLLAKEITDWYREEQGCYECLHPRLVEKPNSMLRVLITSCAEPFKQGFWRVSGGGITVNLDDTQLAHYKTFGRLFYDTEEGRYVFDTGYPRLDKALGAACDEKEDDPPEHADGELVDVFGARC